MCLVFKGMFFFFFAHCFNVDKSISYYYWHLIIRLSTVAIHQSARETWGICCLWPTAGVNSWFKRCCLIDRSVTVGSKLYTGLSKFCTLQTISGINKTFYWMYIFYLICKLVNYVHHWPWKQRLNFCEHEKSWSVQTYKFHLHSVSVQDVMNKYIYILLSLKVRCWYTGNFNPGHLNQKDIFFSVSYESLDSIWFLN